MTYTHFYAGGWGGGDERRGDMQELQKYMTEGKAVAQRNGH